MEMKEYEGQVFSIEQMQELEAMGIDVSNASCMWNSIQDKDYKPYKWLPCFRGEDKEPIEVLRKAFPLTYQEGNIYYCYTFNDGLKLLPMQIELPTWEIVQLIIKPVTFDAKKWRIGYNSYKTVLHSTEGTLTDALFDLIKWCYERGLNSKNNKLEYRESNE